MLITASKLRESIYRLLDGVLKTGKPIEIERKGKRLKIAPVEARHKLARLERHDVLVGQPDDIVHIDWSSEWKPDLK